MNFKVGDWVRNKIFINEKEQVVDIIRDTADSLNFIYFNNDRIALELDYELWQPKEGEFVIPKIINGKAGTYISGNEWCWINKRLGKAVSKNKIVYSDGTEEVIYHSNASIFDGEEIEPFIDTLPTFLKENK